MQDLHRASTFSPYHPSRSANALLNARRSRSVRVLRRVMSVSRSPQSSSAGLSGKRCVGSSGFYSWVVFSNRAARVIANAFSAGFHFITQRALLPSVGSSDGVTRYRHLIAAASFGKCPRAWTACL